MREEKTKSSGPDVLSLGAGMPLGAFGPCLGLVRVGAGRIHSRPLSALGTEPAPPSRLVLRKPARPGDGVAARRGPAGSNAGSALRLGRARPIPAHGRGGAKLGDGGAEDGASARLFALLAAWRRARGRGASDLGRRARWVFERRPGNLRRIVLLGVLRLLPGFGAVGQIDRRGRVAYIGRCGPPGRSKRGGSAKNGGRGPRRRRRISAPGIDPGAMEKTESDKNAGAARSRGDAPGDRAFRDGQDDCPGDCSAPRLSPPA